MRAKKSLGQHWLHDSTTLAEIIEIAEVRSSDTVLEIGPGLGSLTEVLLAEGAQVIAVEKDKELFDALREDSAGLYSLGVKNLVLVNEDILEFDLKELPAGYKVVANIPYYLTSNLVRILSESANPPKSATLLVQKEVAERLAAKPGNMSLLSVTSQMFFEPSLGPVVPAKLFSPPPKVDSQIIKLQRRPTPLFDEQDSKELFRLVKAGFSNRRKTLLNSLSAGLHISKEESGKLLRKAGIDPQTRPQELSLEQWLRLAHTI